MEVNPKKTIFRCRLAGKAAQEEKQSILFSGELIKAKGRHFTSRNLGVHNSISGDSKCQLGHIDLELSQSLSVQLRWTSMLVRQRKLFASKDSAESTACASVTQQKQTDLDIRIRKAVKNCAG